MAKFTIEIPDNVMKGVVEAFCTAYGYQEMIADPDWQPFVVIKGKDRDQYLDPDRAPNPKPQEMINNPESRQRFFVRRVEDFIQGMYVAHLQQKAVAAAQEKARAAPPLGLKTTLVK